MTAQGVVYYAPLAASHIARIDAASGAATVIEPPTPDQGARRVWSDSKGSRPPSPHTCQIHHPSL